MPVVYVTEETKANVEKAASLDNRTMDGEVNHLCKQRINELNAVRDETQSSPKDKVNSTK